MKGKSLCISIVQHQIATLPFDVLIRRIHSSSRTNPSRSLEAHFFSLSSLSVVQTMGSEQPHATPSTLQSAKGLSCELRRALSERLLSDLRQNRKSFQLNLDDFSLILANAIRHRLSSELVSAALLLFTEVLRGAGGTKDRYGQLEAVSRVMEACSCDVLIECPNMTWDEMAALVAVVEQFWPLFTKTSSLCSLLTQFLSAVIAAKLSTISSSSSSSSSSILQTDPVLLKVRCLQLVDAATEALVNLLSTDTTLTWSLSELQGMCAAVQELRRFEDARNFSQYGIRPPARIKFWTRSGVKTTPVLEKVSRFITSQVVKQTGFAADVHAMTLEQVAAVFLGVSSACGAEAVDRIAVPVHSVLNRTIIGDILSMTQVVRIGEASLQVEGATLVLVEVIRCIRRHTHVLTTGAAWDLFLRACALLEGAPLCAQTVVVECLHAMQTSLETPRCLPSPFASGFFSFRLAVATLGTLLVKNDIPATVQMVEIVHSFVTASPLLSDAQHGRSTVARSLFFLASAKRSDTSLPADERRARALHLVTLEARRILDEATGDGPCHLTAAERTMLRNALSKVSASTATHPRRTEATRRATSQPQCATRDGRQANIGAMPVAVGLENSRI